MACEKDVYDAPEEQPVYFEYHFINHAWGYQDFGWLVNGDFLSLEQLEYNLSQADSLIGEVSSSVMDKKKDLIPAAAEGLIKDFQRQGADMGLGVFSCYLYDPEKDAYQYVMLSASGDHQQSNASMEAEKLVDWLKGLVDGYSYY